MKIGKRTISASEPYIIAEIGVNHDGDPARAEMLTELAIAAGADAVKFQCFQAEMLMSRAAGLAEYQRAAGETDPLVMLRRLELPLEVMGRCIERAHKAGRHSMVTVFSLPLVERAAALPWDAFKTASPDVVHRPLLEAVAGQGRPLVVSTGAAEMDEIERAVSWLRRIPGVMERLALLHCVSSYPCDAADASLLAMDDLRNVHAVVGYSDHTQGTDTGALAVRCGAVMLEKHITDDNLRVGPDHAASLDGEAFGQYVALAREAGRRAAEAVRTGAGQARLTAGDAAADVRCGERCKVVLPCERDVRAVSRQSIVAVRDLPAGHLLTRQDVAFKRPGTGLAPWQLGAVLGRVLTAPVVADGAIDAGMVGAAGVVTRA